MKILTIALYDLIKLTRERTSLIITFLMPVIFIVVMGSINFGSGDAKPTLPVGIVNYDSGKVAMDLINEVKQNKDLNVWMDKEETLLDAVKNAEVDVCFIIPNNFSKTLSEGKMPEIKVFKLPSSVDFMAIEGMLEGAYSKLGAKNGLQLYFEEKIKDYDSMKKASAVLEIGQDFDSNMQKPGLVTIEAKTYAKNRNANKIDARSQYILGFIVMFVMWAVVLSAGETLQEKKTNTWGRLNISPIGKNKIVLGKILGTFLRGWVQVVFLIIFSKLVMGISWGDSIGATVLIVSIFLLCVNSIGMFLSSIVKTNSQLGAISSIIITCTCMLAGCYWPLEIVPDYMQKVAQIFPQYWAMKGLTATVGNQGLGTIVTPVLVLAGIGVLFFLLSMINGKLNFNFRKPSLALTNQDKL